MLNIEAGIIIYSYFNLILIACITIVSVLQF